MKNLKIILNNVFLDPLRDVKDSLFEYLFQQRFVKDREDWSGPAFETPFDYAWRTRGKERVRKNFAVLRELQKMRDRSSDLLMGSTTAFPADLVFGRYVNEFVVNHASFFPADLQVSLQGYSKLFPYRRYSLQNRLKSTSIHYNNEPYIINIINEPQEQVARSDYIKEDPLDVFPKDHLMQERYNLNRFTPTEGQYERDST